jgi:hypothetical protein
LQSLNEPGTGFPDGFKQLCLLLGGAVGLDIDEPTVPLHREAGASYTPRNESYSRHRTAASTTLAKLYEAHQTTIREDFAVTHDSQACSLSKQTGIYHLNPARFERRKVIAMLE